MRAAVLLLIGCSLPDSDPHPREQSKPAEQSLPVEGTVAPVEDTAASGSSTTNATTTPQIDVEPTSTDFGELAIGWVTVQQIAIKNVGPVDLEIESLSFVPSDPDDLTMEAIETPLVIPSGEAREATIQWAPTGEGEDHAVLRVDSNDPFTPTVHAELHGTGVAVEDSGT